MRVWTKSPVSAMTDNLELPAGENTARNAIEDDSDWEYEYHETETEVFNLLKSASSYHSTLILRRPST